MQDIRRLAEEIVTREGGFVNDPQDPGGATNFGVTIHTMRRLGLDLTGDGRVTEADVRALGREQAVAIFLEHYYHRPGLSALPEALQPGVFDMFVNAGANAIRLLQRLLGAREFALAVDGVLGPQTLRAAQEAAAGDAPGLATAYAIARREYYYALAERRPASRRFARRRDGGKGGWILRAESFLDPRHHLTEAEHRARTEAWR